MLQKNVLHTRASPILEWKNAMTTLAHQPQPRCRAVSQLPKYANFSKGTRECCDHLHLPAPDYILQPQPGSGTVQWPLIPAYPNKVVGGSHTWMHLPALVGWWKAHKYHPPVSLSLLRAPDIPFPSSRCPQTSKWISFTYNPSYFPIGVFCAGSWGEWAHMWESQFPIAHWVPWMAAPLVF